MDFGLRIRLAKHVDSEHTTKPSVKCGSCDWVGFSQKGLQIHVRRVHGYSVHFCTSCDLHFQSAGDALIHRSSAKHKFVFLRNCGQFY